MKIKAKLVALLLCIAHQLPNTTLNAFELPTLEQLSLARSKSSANGRVGLKLAESINNDTSIAKPIDLEKALASLNNLIITNRTVDADALASAMAGSSVTAIGSAMMSDVDRQMKSNRQRTATLRCGSGTSAWIAAEGSTSTMLNAGSQMGHTLRNWGGSVGFDFPFGDSFQLGVSFTSLYGDLSTDAMDRADGSLDTNYMSIYGQVESGAWRHRFAISAGWGEADITRHIYHEGGSYETNALSNTYSATQFYELGYHLDVNWTLLASFTIQHANVDAYSETGSGAGLEVGSQVSDWGTLAIGIENHILYGGGEYSPSLHSRILFKTYLGDKGSTSEVQFQAGGNSAIIKGTEAGNFGIEMGTGFQLPLGEKGGVIFIDAAIELREELTDANASVGYSISF